MASPLERMTAAFPAEDSDEDDFSDFHSILSRNGVYLMQNLDLEDSILLELLLDLNVITKFQSQIIRGVRGYHSATKVSKLIEILLRKTENDFKAFCDALVMCDLEHIRKKLLHKENPEYIYTKTVDLSLTRSKTPPVSGDHLNSVQKKLAEYYLKDFSDIDLYSRHQEEKTVPMHVLFVPMSWKRYTDGQYSKDVFIENYTDMFRKVSREELQAEVPVSRLVIEGEAGMGKTTFVKRLCYLWALKYTGKEIPGETCEPLLAYTLVIPIILRLVEKNNTIEDILCHQLNLLSHQEIAYVTEQMNKHQRDTLILMDGYDEFTSECECIRSILTKERLPDTLCFITTRPYTSRKLHSFFKNSIDKTIKLLGFKNEQILTYFVQFLTYFGKGEHTAKKFYEYLITERPDLFKLAKIPILCKMISIVWNVYGNLGTSVADLYLLFIQHLFEHQEKKEPDYYKENWSTQRTENLLSNIGKIANDWTSSNPKTLNIVFTADRLKESLGIANFSFALKLGLLTKSHPASDVERSLYGFPHKSLQEFMVAYFLGSADEGDPSLTEFVKTCEDIEVLHDSEVILQFLVSKYPYKANKILRTIILSERNEQESRRLLKILLKLFPYFNKSIKIPLPKLVQITKDDAFLRDFDTDADKIATRFTQLLDMDLTMFRNMRKVKTNDICRYRIVLQIDYITELIIELDKEDQMSTDVNRDMLLSSLTVKAPHHLFTDIKSFVVSFSPDRLHSLTIECKQVTGQLQDTISGFKQLQELRVTDREELEETYKQESLFHSDNLSKIVIHSYCYPALFMIKASTLMLKLQKITKRRLSEAVQWMKKVKTECQVTGLDLSDNDLSSLPEVSEMISLIPHLKTLYCSNCQLSPTNLATIAHAVPSRNNIDTLDLSSNNQPILADGVYRLLLRSSRLRAVRFGGDDRYNDVILSVLRSVKNGALSELCILDLSYSYMPAGCLARLGLYLVELKQLQIINLRHIRNASTDEYVFVYKNVSPLVQHLNVYNNIIVLATDTIWENRLNLKHLQRLNVKLDRTQLEKLQKRMKEISPNMSIYSDEQEDVWKMYVTYNDTT